MKSMFAPDETAADTAGVLAQKAAAVEFNLSTVLITIAAVVVGAMLLHAILGGLLRRASKHRTGRLRWGAIAATALRRPLVLSIWAIAGLVLIGQGMEIANGLMPEHADLTKLTSVLRADVLPPARNFVLVLGMTMFGAGFVRGLQAELEKVLSEREAGGDVTAVQGLGSIAVVIVWMLGALTALPYVGVNTTAVLAVLGLSSAGLAFAAKDLLGNFFGGIMLLFNRPFETGDWVIVNGTEGEIERIGLYATNIRAIDKRLIWIPNQTFTAAMVENPSRRTHRQLSETIGVRYEDLDKVGRIAEDILKELQNTPEIDQEQACRVAFAGYGASTVDISILGFSIETGLTEFLQLRQRLMLKVGEIVQKHGADFAFPTLTLDGPSVAG